MMEEPNITGISFNYDDFQVVRGEFLSRIKAPMITFSDFKVWVNTACIQKFSGIEYVQFLISPNERKIILRPCSENVKDSLAWCIDKDNIRKPRKVTCRLFFAKLLALMNWNVDCRYRIVGEIVSKDTEILMLFDLNSAESILLPKGHRKTIAQTENISGFPKEWRNNF